MQLTEALQWRYATKRFDPAKKVSHEDLELLMQAVNLTASSFGLQPYRVMVVQDGKIKQKLREASYDQPQLTESSHVFVFAAKTDMNGDYVDEYIQLVADTRGLDLTKISGFGTYIKDSLTGKSPEFIVNWNKRQTYMGLSTLLAAAAELRIDSCPMEGFEPGKYDEILGLTDRGLTATVIATVGYRSADDATQAHKKVRLPLEEMFTVITRRPTSQTA